LKRNGGTSEASQRRNWICGVWQRVVSVRVISFVEALVVLALAFHGQALAAATCVVPPASQISWWTGDVDATDLYGVNNPSAVSAVTLVPAKVSDGFKLGKGGHIDIPASPTLANQKFTWNAWVEPAGPGPNDDNFGSIIIDQHIDNTDSSVELAWRATDNRFLFIFGNVESEIIASSDAFPIGAFYLVTATYDGATFRLYVNGVLEGSFAEAKKIAYSSRTWEIGSTDAVVRAQGLPRTWNGVIDEVEAFKVALSASQIQSIFKAGSTGKCKTPVIVTPSTEKFAAQTVGTADPSKVVTIVNNRNLTLTIDPFTFTGADPLDFVDSSTTCGSTLGARKSCKVDVTFTPKQTGSRSAVLNVTDSDAGSPQMVSLSGVGLDNGPKVTLSPASLAFACVIIFPSLCVCSPPRTTTLTNVGQTPLDITDITITGPFSQRNDCPASVAAGQSCTLTVSWLRARGGGELSVSDDGSGSPQTVSLSGFLMCHP